MAISSSHSSWLIDYFERSLCCKLVLDSPSTGLRGDVKNNIDHILVGPVQQAQSISTCPIHNQLGEQVCSFLSFIYFGVLQFWENQSSSFAVQLPLLSIQAVFFHLHSSFYFAFLHFLLCAFRFLCEALFFLFIKLYKHECDFQHGIRAMAA